MGRKFYHGKNKNNKPLPSIELEIVDVAFGGKGVARKDGKVYFVSGALPGDRVICHLEKDKKNYSEGYVKEFLGPSNAEQQNICEYFGHCGGCQWLGIDYHTQKNWKIGFIRDALRKIADVADVEIAFFDSEDQLNYRSRVMIRVHVNAEGRASFGFFKVRSRNLIAINRCEIASEKINKLIASLDDFVSIEMSNSKFRLEIQEIPAAIDDEEALFLTLSPAQGKNQNLKPMVKFLEGLDCTKWVGSHAQARSHEGVVFERDQGINFYASPSQFYQVNIATNRLLRTLVTERAQSIDPKIVYDIYCGSGNLSLPLGVDASRDIYGVELNSLSIKNAKLTASKNEVLKNSNFYYESMDASKHITCMIEKRLSVDLVIADPPREGMASCIEDLLKLQAPDILYISCDPTTLSRDLKNLISGGYEIFEYLAFDFFPQTYHIESMVHLKKS